MGLQPLLTTTLHDFFRQRTAKIVHKTAYGRDFSIEAGVPQGSTLSPTLYNIYIHDIPEPHSMTTRNIIFADDVSQIISCNTKTGIVQMVEREIEVINAFEKKWKIRTNATKFQIVALDRVRKDNLYDIGNRNFKHAIYDGRFIGFQIKTSEPRNSEKQRSGLAGSVLGGLQRFRGMSSAMKRRLYLAKARSYMLYPVAKWAALGFYFFSFCNCHLFKK